MRRGNKRVCRDAQDGGRVANFQGWSGVERETRAVRCVLGQLYLGHPLSALFGAIKPSPGEGFAVELILQKCLLYLGLRDPPSQGRLSASVSAQWTPAHSHTDGQGTICSELWSPNSTHPLFAC